jgi:hypothetical protein
LITGQAQFFTELHKAVQEGFSQGKSVEELQASVKLPGAVDEWVSEKSLKQQIADTYREIKEGKPRGELGQ